MCSKLGHVTCEKYTKKDLRKIAEVFGYAI
jgi:hypothetical protein